LSPPRLLDCPSSASRRANRQIGALIIEDHRGHPLVVIRVTDRRRLSAKEETEEDTRGGGGGNSFSGLTTWTRTAFSVSRRVRRGKARGAGREAAGRREGAGGEGWESEKKGRVWRWSTRRALLLERARSRRNGERDAQLHVAFTVAKAERRR